MYVGYFIVYGLFTSQLFLVMLISCPKKINPIVVTLLFEVNPWPAEPGYTLPLQTVYSEVANWSGYALFVINYVNLYKQSRSSNLIGLKLEVGVAS